MVRRWDRSFILFVNGCDQLRRLLLISHWKEVLPHTSIIICKAVKDTILICLLKDGGDDLQSVYDIEGWEGCIQNSYSLFLSNKFKEIQYWIFHRLHRTPYIMNNMDPIRSPRCLTCKLSTGTYIHCFWTEKKNSIIFLLVLPPKKAKAMDEGRSRLLNI